MSRTIMLIPTGTSVGLTSVSLGVIRAMERKGVRLSVFKPIAQPRAGGDAPDQTTTIVRANSNLPAAEPLKMSHVESLLSSNQKDVLMEEIIARYHESAKDAEVVLVVGSKNSSNSNRLAELAQRAGKLAKLIDSADDIQEEWVKGVACIGVTAGASAPDILVQQVIQRLRELGGEAAIELIGREENIVFEVPKELRVEVRNVQ
ncbi:MAG TPA: hypothetical protein DEF84_21220 [Leclercia adecarboxylata]|nr:hypothetical protein [Leclercia adecarboxylata]